VRTYDSAVARLRIDNLETLITFDCRLFDSKRQVVIRTSGLGLGVRTYKSNTRFDL